jgi:prevent-host-death family protein
MGRMEVNIHEAKTHFSELLQRVLAGEEVVIAKSGKPVARLVAIKSKRAPRPLGTGKGDFVVPDDFDAPMPDFEAEFYGEASLGYPHISLDRRRRRPAIARGAKRVPQSTK